MPFGPLTGIGGIDKQSDIFIINESPSKEDAEINELLYDYKGLLLHKLMKSAGLTKYYLSSLLRCHSPGIPTKTNISKCFNWIDKELEIVKPKIIITLGHIVSYTVLSKHIKKSDKIKDYAGKIYEWRNYKVIPIYGLHYLYMRGKKEHIATIQQLKGIKGILNDIQKCP